ncbi:MAG: flagellar hook-associated protein FlgK [Micavibrio sp.]
MSFQALSSALSGLRVAQQQLNTISSNVSNATTAGYSRKILPQSTQVIASTGEIIGVRADTLIRKVDLNLERQLWTQVSAVSELDVKAAYLDQIEKFHGATHDQRSIAAGIADLKDKFAALSDSPADGFLLQSVLSTAQTLALKFNDFGQLLTQLRIDAQDEMAETVNRTNTLLKKVADINAQIKSVSATGRTTASLEDQRDIAVNELAGLMNITFFTRGDGVMVIQTSNGYQLADERAEQLHFKPSPLGVNTFYPDSAAGIFVGGDPEKVPTAWDIAPTNVGGTLGGLIDLRDNTLVQYQAQLDELAHKLALRMDAQGLRLFTDSTGAIPSDAPPDPSTTPPTPVAYVGFASIIRVNEAVINDISLIQQGTYTSDRAIPTASNEVIRRVIQFGFGDIQYQEIAGTINLDAPPGTDLQSWLGLPSRNNVVGGINLSNFSELDSGTPGALDLYGALEQFFPDWPNNAQFNITFSEPRLGAGPATINIDLGAIAADPAYAIGGPGINNALDQLIAAINDGITAAGLPPELATTATRNANGQLVLKSQATVEFSANGFTDAMGTEAFGAIGFREGVYVTEDPYFDIQVGNNDPVRITIEPGDTITELVAKLEYNPATGSGVPGLFVDFDTATGHLHLRPGIDDSHGGPQYGGDIRIVSGPGTTSAALNPALAVLPSGVSVASALFGRYTVNGTTVTETSPVTNVSYRSETVAGSGIYVPFRQDALGASGSTSTRILTGESLLDFSQKMVNAHAQDIIAVNAQKSDEDTMRMVLQERFLNETGVNIDEELSMLIVVQTAYSAAARAVSAADSMFQELLNAFR